MQDILMSLRVRTTDSSCRKPSHLVFDWNLIDQALEAVFSAGGSFTLEAKIEIVDSPGAFYGMDKISILSLPGRYVLTVFPPIDTSKPPGKLRYLWQDSQGPHGTEMVEDCELDTRLFCCDINIAKTICLEFFTARKVTEKIISLTVEELSTPR